MESFRSSRLDFRVLTPADVTANYVGWLNDPDVTRYLETRWSVQDDGSCRQYVEQVRDDPGSHLLGMFCRSSGRHIGNIKLGPIRAHHATAQLSLFIGDQAYWGRGYAREAIQRVSREVFQRLGLQRLEAGCYEDNLGSLRAFLKCGFVVEGFFRSHVVCGESRQGCFWLGLLREELTDSE